MKCFLFHDDKSTHKDELFLALFILACLAVGILCYAFAPSDWFVSQVTIKMFGLIWIITGLIFIPGLIHRLFSNNKSKKND